jgi:FAD/FMN-containing dehydrogenase
MKKLLGYLAVGFHTSLNILLNALTGGRFLWLEGRVRGGVFHNWALDQRYRPLRVAQPDSEEALAEVVRTSQHLRAFGAGHSFNPGVVSEEALVSLDRHSGIVRADAETGRVTVRGGMRVRDISRALLEMGLAFDGLPSHDAQSIGGILSTDVHGTGRDWGFVSEHVVRLRLVDGEGRSHDCTPEDPLFQAAIGGIGAVGIISEVEVQAVPRFHVEQKVEISDLDFVEPNLDRLLEENDHLSLYLFPFTRRCQINSWNRTERPKSRLGELREFLAISIDASMAAWAGGLLAYTKLLPATSGLAHRLKKGTNLVMDSHAAYNRTLYHQHQEYEVTVPYENSLVEIRRFIELYERLYREETLPYTLFEIRFTPAGHARSLLGAGVGRRSTWIHLVTSQSEGWERYFSAAEALAKEIGARPHLGKFCEACDHRDLERLHGERFASFLKLVHEHDPQGRFSNAFTRRLFGTG